MNHIFSVGKSPALGEAMNMGVYWNGRHAKSLCHDYTGGLMANPWEIFERDKICWNLAVMMLEQQVA